ncbi:MAG: hypothetical protein AB1599_08165 [Planctomycetota bacterium]
MSEDTPKNSYPGWYKTVLIVSTILAILLSIVFIFGVITEKDDMIYRAIHSGSPRSRAMYGGMVFFLLFAIIGIPALAFLSWGLHSENKTVKHLLYGLSGGWLAGWTVLFALLLFFR